MSSGHDVSEYELGASGQWCVDPPEDRVISMFAGLLANHDRVHSLRMLKISMFASDIVEVEDSLSVLVQNQWNHGPVPALTQVCCHTFLFRVISHVLFFDFIMIFSKFNGF
jgi:hypothetical protein